MKNLKFVLILIPVAFLLTGCTSNDKEVVLTCESVETTETYEGEGFYFPSTEDTRVYKYTVKGSKLTTVSTTFTSKLVEENEEAKNAFNESTDLAKESSDTLISDLGLSDAVTYTYKSDDSKYTASLNFDIKKLTDDDRELIQSYEMIEYVDTNSSIDDIKKTYVDLGYTCK